MRLRLRHFVLLTAAALLLADVVLVWVAVETDFAFDFTCCYQQAAQRLLDDPSTLYDWSDTYTFRYTPSGALLFVPLIPLSETTAAWAWLGVKVVVLAIGAGWFARRWSGSQRWLVLGLVFAFPPLVHDMLIGNVSTITFLVFMSLARWQDGRGGIALGLLIILMPKPHLLPVFAYLALRRRLDFIGASFAMVAGVVLGIALVGIEPWMEFVQTLREPLGRTFTANVGFSSLFGPAGVIIGAVMAIVVFGTAVVLGGDRGYAMAILSGIIAGPYTFIHYLAGTLVAAEPVLRAKPRRLTPFPWLLVVFPLIPVWLVGLSAVVRASPPPSEESRAGTSG